MSIKQKFLMVLLVAVVATAGAVYWTYLFVENVKQTLLEVKNIHQTMVSLTQENTYLFRAYERDSEIGVSISEPSMVVASRENINKITTQLEKVARLSPDQAVMIGGLITEMRLFVKANEELVGLITQGDMQDARVKDLIAARKSIDDRLSYMEDFAKQRFDLIVKQVEDDLVANSQIYPAVMGLVGCLLFAFSALVLHSIQYRIRRLTGHFSHTNLDALRPMDIDSHPDEVGQLVDTANHMLLSLQEARLRLVDRAYVDQILTAMKDMLFVVDAAGVIHSRNQAAERAVGDLVSNLHSVFNEPFAIIGGTEVELTRSTEKGETYSYLLSISRLNLETHDMFVAVAKDLTMIKATELQRDQMKMQLAQTARLAALGEMGAGVAHELNNPLASIAGYTALVASRYKQDETLTRFMDKITISTERMAKIIKHMRNFATKTSLNDRAVISYRKPIEDALILLGKQLRIEDIHIELSLRQDCYVVGDSTLLESIFQNLMANARDAFQDLPEGEKRQIEITDAIVNQEGKEYVRISVRDNAGGISKEIIDNVFNPFFTTKDVGKGTGLGLSISHSIAQDHDGWIKVESQDGWTRFDIYLPTTNQRPAVEPMELDMVVEHISSAIADSFSDDCIRVAIIDDEPFMCEIQAGYFDDFPEFRVRLFSKPDHFLRSMAGLVDCPYDLILTDIKMPLVDGYKVMEFVRNMPGKQPAIVVVSGHGSYELDKEKFDRYDVFKVVEKPLPTQDVYIGICKEACDSRARFKVKVA